VNAEALLRAALPELDERLAAVVRAADLVVTERLEEWSGIGLRRMLTLTLGLAAAGLAELTFGPSGYERTLRAFSTAVPAAAAHAALADLFLQYARPRLASAYRGAAPSASGELLHEAQAFASAYLAARGAPPNAVVLVGTAAGIDVQCPRELGPNESDQGARFARGLREIATAFQSSIRFV
jgi:hypothetical protein